MSLDKAIASGKEHRKPYYGCKAVDRTCRNHGSCSWCASGRFHKFRKRLLKAEYNKKAKNLGRRPMIFS